MIGIPNLMIVSIPTDETGIPDAMNINTIIRRGKDELTT